jgi:5-methylcytosine-specific restriction protein A
MGHVDTGNIMEKFMYLLILSSWRTGHDYDNHWEGSILVWYGKTSSHIDQPLITEMLDENSKVHFFIRIDSRKPFTYHGIGKIKSFEVISPV